MKNDGNNVSLDREARLLAENALRFNVASNLMRVADPVDPGGDQGGSKLMSLFSALSVGASGMAAQRTRAELLVENMANSETTRTPEGGPYRRKDAVFESGSVESPFSSIFGAQLDAPTGVAVSGIVTDTSEPERRYMPGHPDADKDGYVAFPKINPAEDMVDLMGSARELRGQRGRHRSGERHDSAFHRLAPLRLDHGSRFTPISAPALPSSIRPAGETSSDSGFQDVFSSAIGQVESMSRRASTTVERFLSGDGEDLHTVALATQQADLAFQMFQQVRNKVVGAYQEIMKMQM